MTLSLSHRGPDASDFYVAEDAHAALGFRRLAIRDLDPRANQPMRASNPKFRIVFNGEIYNTDDLSSQYLTELSLKTTSDTEVLIELLVRRGASVLPELDGMFGFAFHDAEQGTLLLARDQSGEKPLYLYHGNGWLAFASEIRAFETFGLQIDPSQAPLFFQYGYLPAPATFYQCVTQIEPGEAISIAHGEIQSRHKFHRWERQSWGTRINDSAEFLDSLLDKAVRSRLVSDVPVGVFLSGGIDSSLVATVASQHLSKPLPAFTIAVDQPEYDESPYASKIAQYLNLDHHIIRMTPEELYNNLDDFLDCYEQPYADTSGLPSMLLCKAASETIKVALCGDGGDEFFSGYQRYKWFRTALNTQRFPHRPRKAIGSLFKSRENSYWNRIGDLLTAKDPASLYGSLLRPWTASPLEALFPQHESPEQFALGPLRKIFARSDQSHVSQAACFDATHYIPGDLQVKMDRASMRYSLEVRCPLLHPELTHYGASRIFRGKSQIGAKHLLREALGRKIPKQLFDRPKKGFSLPIASWLSGPLKERFRDTLNQTSFKQCDWIDHATVNKVWYRFETGEKRLAKSLWLLFTLAHWTNSRPSTRVHANSDRIRMEALV